MSDNSEKFLGLLNLPEETLKAIQGSELSDEQLLELSEAWKTAEADRHKRLLENDAEFTKAYEDKGYKAAEGKYKHAASEQIKSVLGLTAEEYKQADGKTKPVRELLELGVEKMTATLSESTTGKANEYKAEAANWEKKFTELTEQITEKSHPAFTDLQTQLAEVTQAREKDRRMSELEKLMPAADTLTVRHDHARMILASELDSSFKWGFVGENNSFAIMDQDGTLPKGDGDVITDPSVIVAKILTPYVRKSNGQEQTTHTVVTTADPEKVELKGHNLQVQKKMEEAIKSYGKE